MDYTIPRFNGLVAIAALKEIGIEVPIIVISGNMGEEKAVETMKAGAYDYVMKQNISRLLPATERALEDSSMRLKKKRYDTTPSELEKEYHIAVEASNNAFVLFEEKRFLYVNRRFFYIFGYESFGDISDKMPFFMVHPDDYDEVIKYYEKKTLMESAPPLHEFRAIKKGGSIIHMEMSIKTMAYKGRVVTLAIMRDISTRKKAEEDRRRIFELSIDMFSISGFDGYFKQVNPAWETALGWKAEELLSKPYNEFIHPDDREANYQAVDILLKNGRPLIGFVNRYLARNGSFQWLSWNSYPLVSEGLIFSFARNVTRQKKDAEDLALMLSDIREATKTIIDVIITAVEARDPYTSGHQKRVSMLAYAIAQEMGLSQDKVDGIHIASMIHDLGKISIPAEILSMPRKLTTLEFGLIRAHPQIGFDVLRDIQFSQPVAVMILQHHERLDGLGYPAGLKNDEILLGSRIIAVADVVEAMISHRPYRPALGICDAINEIKRLRGTAFDERVVDACEKLFVENNFTLE